MSDLVNKGTDVSEPAPAGSTHRDAAYRRVQRKRKVVGDAVAYVAINVFLVVVWAMTGTGYFWPGWVMAGWGLLLVLDVWGAYYRKPITDADIDQELARHR